MGPAAGKAPCNRTGNHRARFSRGLPPNVTRGNGVHRRARLVHDATPRGPLHQHGVTTVPAARRAATSCTGRGAYRPSWPEPRTTARRNKEHEGDARARARRAAEDAEVTEAQSRGSRPVRCVLRTRTRTEKAARRDKAQSETEQEQVDGASGVGRWGGAGAEIRGPAMPARCGGVLGWSRERDLPDGGQAATPRTRDVQRNLHKEGRRPRYETCAADVQCITPRDQIPKEDAATTRITKTKPPTISGQQRATSHAQVRRHVHTPGEDEARIAAGHTKDGATDGEAHITREYPHGELQTRRRRHRRTPRGRFTCSIPCCAISR